MNMISPTPLSIRCLKPVSLALLAGVLLAPLGCKMKVLAPTSEDTVRERVAKLEKANRELELENEGLRSQLAAVNKDRSPEEQEQDAATPELAEVRIASSSIVKEQPDGALELVLRVAPSDDRARFLQIVGSLTVRVVAVPNEGEPIPLAAERFDSLQVREAWRGGVLGSSYVFDVPLKSTQGKKLPPAVDVVIVFKDSRSGRTLRDEVPVRVASAKAG